MRNEPDSPKPTVPTAGLSCYQTIAGPTVHSGWHQPMNTLCNHTWLKLKILYPNGDWYFIAERENKPLIMRLYFYRRALQILPEEYMISWNWGCTQKTRQCAVVSSNRSTVCETIYEGRKIKNSRIHPPEDSNGVSWASYVRDLTKVLHKLIPLILYSHARIDTRRLDVGKIRGPSLI
jgi:hypothetical protein